jgi:biopolymer transport protein ExbB
MDPSRGALLELLVQKKSLWEQYQEGGIVGYVITGLFVFGVILTLIRLMSLLSIGRAVRAQMKSNTPGDNPLGRIMKVYLDNQDADVENLELKLDEAILKETPKIEWGIGIVKVLAALSPLLGLLGTVTGMIGTFQAITLFGTGDPKTMAGGISTALVTTVLGLVSAIPLIFLHSLLASQSRSIIHILEEQSAGLIAEHAEKES